MDEVKIWALEDGSQAKPLESKSHTDSEWLLEDTLVKNPDLLEEDLTLIGRQTPTEGGPLDLLGVDRDGRLALFELKRGNLTRDAVAQIIDYASDLEAKDFDSLVDHISEHSGKHGIDKIEDFAEWYGQEFDGLDPETLRPLRMFLVGLGVDAKTERMVTFLANGMDISLLTFHAFAHDGKTFLAKQVHVEVAEDSSPGPARRRLSKAEKTEKLKEEVQRKGVQDLFVAVRGMLRENWHGPIENPGETGLTIKLRGRTSGGKRGPRSYARIDHRWRGVFLIFYWNAVRLYTGEFERLSKEIPFKIWPDGRDLTKDDIQVQFLLTPDEWETHKEELSVLTKGVYEAWQEEQKGT